MMWIGNGPGEGGCSLHNTRYDFNDDALPIGASFFARLAERFLAQDRLNRRRITPNSSSRRRPGPTFVSRSRASERWVAAFANMTSQNQGRNRR